MFARLRPFLAALLASACLCGTALAQERFSIFVGSDPSNVERMLRLADLKDDDVVTDLGSGDGRIVIGAAKLNPRLTGIGVDVDAKLVKEATQAAAKEGVGERVRFVHQNAFDADLSNVSVIFMWLWPELQKMLRPKILAEARPGTRVVTNVWDLGNWQPDRVDQNGPPVSLWIVPARVAGYWTWDLPIRGKPQNYGAILEQRFQQAEGFVRVGPRRGVFSEVKLTGTDLRIRLDMTIPGLGFARHLFSGTVAGDTITGSVRITAPSPDNREREETIELPWRATRAAASTYFAPTGIEAAR